MLKGRGRRGGRKERERQLQMAQGGQYDYGDAHENYYGTEDGYRGGGFKASFVVHFFHFF